MTRPARATNDPPRRPSRARPRSPSCRSSASTRRSTRDQAVDLGERRHLLDVRGVFLDGRLAGVQGAACSRSGTYSPPSGTRSLRSASRESSVDGECAVAEAVLEPRFVDDK